MLSRAPGLSTLVLSFCLCAPASAGAQAPRPHGPELRPGDAVRVVVKDEPQLGGDFPVDSDGFVLLPIVGRVRVVDRPFPAVRSELHAAFSADVVDAVVQLTPLLRVAVLGEVRQPGLFAVDPTHSFADVLALAGGLTSTADPKRISVMREGRLVAAPRDIAGGEAALQLRSGDQVFVGRRSWYGEHAGVLIGAAASVATAAVTSLIIR